MTKRRVDRDKDQRKEGEGQQGPRKGCRVTRAKERIERDKGQEKD